MGHVSLVLTRLYLTSYVFCVVFNVLHVCTVIVCPACLVLWVFFHVWLVGLVVLCCYVGLLCLLFFLSVAHFVSCVYFVCLTRPTWCVFCVSHSAYLL